jgi:hypothetical protein
MFVLHSKWPFLAVAKNPSGTPFRRLPITEKLNIQFLCPLDGGIIPKASGLRGAKNLIRNH